MTAGRYALPTGEAAAVTARAIAQANAILHGLPVATAEEIDVRHAVLVGRCPDEDLCLAQARLQRRQAAVTVARPPAPETLVGDVVVAAAARLVRAAHGDVGRAAGLARITTTVLQAALAGGRIHRSTHAALLTAVDRAEGRRGRRRHTTAA